MSATGIISKEEFDKWLALFMQPDPRNNCQMTEVDNRDGTYRAVRPDGSTAAIYGEQFRAAIQKANENNNYNQAMSNNDSHIILDKELRRDIDAIIQKLKTASTPKFQPRENDAPIPLHRGSRERSLAITKLQEAVMWLGMDLKAINDESGGAENPYPHSKDPSNTKIDPTADGLKL